jgi:hypothetical protein
LTFSKGLLSKIKVLVNNLLNRQPKAAASVLQAAQVTQLQLINDSTRTLPGLEDLVQLQATIDLKRWLSMLSVSTSSAALFISRVTIILSPMQLKISALLKQLMRETPVGDLCK